MNRVQYIRKRIRGKVLDVGYYACTLHQEVLAAAGKENVIGIDTEGPNQPPQYIKGSAEKMPFEENTFDTLIAGELIEHLKAPENFIKEAHRVLKAGGEMLITTPNKDSLMNRIFHNNIAPLHFSLFDTKLLRGLLERNGFEIIDFSYLPYTMESSEGSSKPWSFPFRRAISVVLPKKLKEEMLVTTRKKV